VLQAGNRREADLVTVYPADPGVECLQALLLDVPLLLPACIVQVVGVNDAHNMVKLVCPALTMVVPVEVLWLLKNSYISLQHPPMRWNSSVLARILVMLPAKQTMQHTTLYETKIQFALSRVSSCLFHIQRPRPMSEKLDIAIGNTT